MKFGKSVLFLVFCSVGGYVWGMSDAPKPARPKCVFTFSVAPSAQILGIKPVAPVFIPEHSEFLMIKPGRTLILGNKLFLLPIENSLSASNTSLKRKPSSYIANTSASKKSEPTQQLQLKTIGKMATKPITQAEEKLLQVCNAQSKKRGLGVTLRSFPKDLVVDVKIKKRFLEETILSPIQAQSNTSVRSKLSDYDAAMLLVSMRLGKN